MRKIVYYVASSLDGYISGPDGDISGFEPVMESEGIKKYKQDLEDFDTIIMGRKTFEFGYRYGLKPGQPAYPLMEHYVFSNNLIFEDPSPKVHVKPVDLEEVISIRQQAGSDIYLCGGGQFAGWLLDNQQIDILKIKLNPLILGKGVRLFGNSTQSLMLELIESETYDKGLQIITYTIKY
jgi:dihydrofolate reductase